MQWRRRQIHIECLSGEKLSCIDNLWYLYPDSQEGNAIYWAKYCCGNIILYKTSGLTFKMVVAPWFRLRLPSCGLGFESQAHHLCFFQFSLVCVLIVGS